MRFVFSCLLTALFATPAIAAAPQPYVPDGKTCDGYPRLSIGMAKGYCAGLVLAPKADGFRARQVKMPRMLLQLPGKNRWLVTDMGSWTPRQGAVWRLDIGGSQTRLLSKLAMPHTIAMGPDGQVYVGEMSRIFRFDPAAAGPMKSIVTVVDGLPDNRLHDNRHPLSHFVFDGNGDLLVNVGAATDHCAPPKGQALPLRCADESTALIRRYSYLGKGRWSDKPSVFARGLRNSLVLLRHDSGTIVQAENSYDFAPAADRPYEEINVVRNGAHYGWPYCYDMRATTPLWLSRKPMDCAGVAHAKPAALLPPHAAPLGAVYYRGAMFPQLSGKLLMTWHGYRATGSRLVVFDVDAKGVPVVKAKARYPEYSKQGIVMKPYREGPAAEPQVLTTGWDLKAGVRPAGAPVGVTIADDGAIWIADDRNAAIIRIAADKP